MRNSGKKLRTRNSVNTVRLREKNTRYGSGGMSAAAAAAGEIFNAGRVLSSRFTRQDRIQGERLFVFDVAHDFLDLWVCFLLFPRNSNRKQFSTGVESADRSAIALSTVRSFNPILHNVPKMAQVNFYRLFHWKQIRFQYFSHGRIRHKKLNNFDLKYFYLAVKSYTKIYRTLIKHLMRRY